MLRTRSKGARWDGRWRLKASALLSWCIAANTAGYSRLTRVTSQPSLPKRNFQREKARMDFPDSMKKTTHPNLCF